MQEFAGPSVSLHRAQATECAAPTRRSKKSAPPALADRPIPVRRERAAAEKINEQRRRDMRATGLGGRPDARGLAGKRCQERGWEAADREARP